MRVHMCFDVWTWHRYSFGMVVLMWYMNLDHIFRNWRESKGKTNTISQCYRMKQAEQINRTTNILHGTLKQDNTRRETPVNERKINDRITENSGRKTVFPISFGISCSWNWQSLALPHTHTLAHSLSLCRWARIGTSDFSFSRLQSIGLFFDFRRLLFFSRFLSLASLFIADDVAVVIVYDYWLQDIAARSIVHFFFFLARCRRAQVFWHKALASHPHPLIHTDFSYTFVFHVTEDVCCCCSSLMLLPSESIDWFSLLSVHPVQTCTHTSTNFAMMILFILRVENVSLAQ